LTLGYKEDKPTVYHASQVTFPAVKFNQLVKECANSCGVNTNQTKSVIDALVNRIVHYMELGHGVKMGDFGSFKPTFRSCVTQTADDANANTIKVRVIRFFPGKSFRNMLNDLEIEAAGESYDCEE
ncbi:MAG: HU family DNA-binding protein, partial [Prevotellaceae bacterium]|nr:HU family DNA-binding protein [Candidatus Minthosoma caballi]